MFRGTFPVSPRPPLSCFLFYFRYKTILNCFFTNYRISKQPSQTAPSTDRFILAFLAPVRAEFPPTTTPVLSDNAIIVSAKQALQYQCTLLLHNQINQKKTFCDIVSQSYQCYFRLYFLSFFTTLWNVVSFSILKLMAYNIQLIFVWTLN